MGERKFELFGFWGAALIKTYTNAVIFAEVMNNEFIKEN